MSDTVVITTNLGSITVALDAAKAPKSVANFLRYVDAGHYEGTIFHRVIKDFMIQGGGYDTHYEKKPTFSPVENEGDNGLENVKGSLAMARTSDPHSATAQFFINTVDNAFLNQKGKTGSDWGYAVFGRVVDGMDVVEKIRVVRTGSGGPFSKDAPVEQVVIESIRRA
ncbi:MAG: peptidylprolyl isomerase [Polyangiaceae bacterium]